MVLVGSSEVSGSWKIIAMSLPRILRRSASGSPTSSLPFSLTEPPTIAPPGGSSPMIDRPVMDLPQPDSPTSPRVSPASIRRSILPTACTTDLVSWMCVDRSVISRTGAMRGYSSGQWTSAGTLVVTTAGSAAPQPHVERVAQRVAEQVARHHDQHDARADRVDQPPVAVLQVPHPVGEHVAPVLGRVVQPEAKEAERGHGQDRIGDVERDVDDDHAERVRDQVPADQSPLAGPGGPGRRDEVPLSQREHLATDKPGRHQPGERPND